MYHELRLRVPSDEIYNNEAGMSDEVRFLLMIRPRPRSLGLLRVA